MGGGFWYICQNMMQKSSPHLLGKAPYWIFLNTKATVLQPIGFQNGHKTVDKRCIKEHYNSKSEL